MKTRLLFQPSFLSTIMALSKDTCRLWFFISTFTVLVAFFQLTEAGGKTLVLVDNANTKETHSIFFNSLKGRKKLAKWQGWSRNKSH